MEGYQARSYQQRHIYGNNRLLLIPLLWRDDGGVSAISKQELHFISGEYIEDLDQVVDVQVIYHKREARTLSAAHEFYCGCTFDGAHGALADTEATYNVLRGQLAKYDDLPNDVDSLDEYTTQRRVVDFAGRFIYNDKDEVVFNFGKYKGQRVSDVLTKEPGYVGWMMNGDFPGDTKFQLQKIKKAIDLKSEKSDHA